MNNILSRYAPHAFNDGLNKCNFIGLKLISDSKSKTVLDLGCNDGSNTMYFTQHLHPERIVAIEYDDKSARKAAEKNINCIKADLNQPWPVDSGSFDLIISSQNLEHMHNSRLYLQECYRCLRPKGKLVVLTENLASWINIGALFFGWQPFSTTNINGISIGNPLIWHKDQQPAISKSKRSDFSKEAMSGVEGHVRVLTYQGLHDLLAAVGFSSFHLESTGYLPFWGPVSNWLCRIDPRHGHFLIAYAIK